MIIDWSKDDIYQHQYYIGLSPFFNWSGSTAIIVATVALTLNSDSLDLTLYEDSLGLTLNTDSLSLTLWGKPE